MAEAPRQGGRRLNLLIVDGNEEQLRATSEGLGERGYDVDSANSGEEAIERIAGKRPDIVILEIKLQPEMDGTATMGKIHGRDRTQPVIIYASESGPKDNFMNWSADAYELKSGGLDKLSAKIENVAQCRGIL